MLKFLTLFVFSTHLPELVYVFDLSGRIVMSSRNYNNEWNEDFRGDS